MEKKYWKGIDELVETPQFVESRDQEFPTQTSIEEFLGDENLAETSTARRDFLKFLGFSVAAATVAACEAPVTKAVPYVNKPENVTPGMPTWYASTFYDGVSYASILVKTREGRPIYIKGNRDFGVSGTNAQIIGSVLGLYDSARLRGPQIKNKSGEWEDAKYSKVDPMIKNALKTSKSAVLVTPTVLSMPMFMAISEMQEMCGGTRDAETGMVTGSYLKHISYDAVSYAGMRAANKASFGITDPYDMDQRGSIPSYDFSKAKTIVSVGADFLSSWLMPTMFAGQYASRRNPDGEWMSKHFQFESVMSITGSNADVRGMIKPSEEANVLAAILKGLGKNTSGASASLSPENTKLVGDAVKALKAAGKDALVVCGSNNKSLQILTNKINSALGAYESTIDLNAHLNVFMSNDEEMNAFVSSVKSGKGPEAAIFLGVNPVYTLPDGADFGKKLSSVKHKISLSMYADETATQCDVIVPEHHALEDWRDYCITPGHYAIAQPTIRPLHNTASALESMLVWSGKASRGGKDSKVAYDYMKGLWMQYRYYGDEAAMAKFADPEEYFNMAVHNGGDAVPVPKGETPVFRDAAMSGLKFPKGGGTEVVFYQKAAIGTGQYAGNPWLQEMADPISKVTWDNYITMNPADMEKGSFTTYFDQEYGLDLATLTIGNNSVTLPVYPSPGQAIGTVGVALGYGRGANGENIGKAAFQTKEYGGYETDENGNPKPIGANVFPMTNWQNGTLNYWAANASIKAKGESYLIASTQIHNTVAARHSVVRETTLDIYQSNDSEAYNPPHMLGKLDKDGHHVSAPVSEFDLWDAHPVEKIGHRWGMTIDLSSCFGCGSCLIACQSENNVPVVGKDEVRRGREMAWLRIDRYYASEVEVAVGQRGDEFSYESAEQAQVNPKVVHMPMMCHHCNHAPCETVCPVAATTHSNEGLNQMTYNRCIGTRYCANNCPYKVRRFNWFNYPSYKKQAEVNPAQDDLGRMVLNPDVTVRTRGVMEKCSMCVQRIQAGKLDAKKAGRPVQDGDYSTACQDACPANAITVGDWNDTDSGLRKSAEDKRSYQALEEVGVKPNVWFKVKVRNGKNDALAAIQKGGGGHGGNNHGHSEGHGHEENNHH